MKRTTLCLLMSLLPAASLSSAAPGGYVPFDVLVETADAIVAGTIISGVMSSPDYTVSLSVDRVFKGAEEGNVINVRGRLPDLVRAQGPVPMRDRGLWFLRKDATSREWVVILTQSHGSIRSSYYCLPADVSYSQTEDSSGTLTELLVEIIAEAIARNDNDDEDAMRLLRSIRFLESPRIDRVFERLLERHGTRAQVLAAARLLPQSRREALVAAENLLKTPLGQFDTAALVDGLYQFRGTDAESVDVLGRLATSASSQQRLSDPFVLRASGFSLARIHNRHALRYLAALLESKDALLREEAVAAFSLFTAGVPVVSDHQRAQVVAEYLLPRTQGKVQLTLPFESQQTVRHFHLGAFR